MICVRFLLINFVFSNNYYCFSGTIAITTTGTQFIGDRLVLTCTISPFVGTVTWAQDGVIRTICAATLCTIPSYGNYTTFSFASTHINVTFEPVDSSIDGEWRCTHATLGNASFTVTAMNETQSKCSLINYIPCIINYLVVN